VTPAIILLSSVTAERLGELWLARRNTARLLANGGVESASEHYPFIVLLHAAWLAGLWWLGWNQPLNLVWLALFLGLQALRMWVLTTLGRRWTTRIVTIPAEPLVGSGPYRFFFHPNYAVVGGEIAALPLCLGLPWFALVFSAANALVLWVRIKAENAALARASNE
jgi:methyltransferase